VAGPCQNLDCIISSNEGNLAITQVVTDIDNKLQMLGISSLQLQCVGANGKCHHLEVLIECLKQLPVAGKGKSCHGNIHEQERKKTKERIPIRMFGLKQWEGAQDINSSGCMFRMLYLKQG
jgi:hypothetical protein